MTRGFAGLTALAVLLLAGCTGDGNGAETPGPAESTTSASLEPSEGPPDDDARAGLLLTARTGAERILSYDYRTLDQDAELAAPLMTTEFQQKYRTLIASLRDTAVATEASTRATSRGEGLIGVSESAAAVLVLVDQTTRRGTQPKTVVPQAAVISLALEDGRWLVSELETGAPASPPTEPDPDRRAVLEAATTFAESMLSVSWRTIDADVAETLALATDPFRTEYDESSAVLREAITSSRTVQTGKAVAAGLSSWSESEATVLVATSGTSRAGSTATVTRGLRLELHLVREGGRWLASDVTFVERPS